MVTTLTKKYTLTKSDALLVTDMQKDFLPGGALPIENGDEIIPALNYYIKHFAAAKAPVFASRDWHPADHISFKAQGGPWPPHCVQETSGAKFTAKLKLPNHTRVVSKATNSQKEAYSVFEGTSFARELKALDVKRLFIGGLATDYCVVNTVLDATKLGFETVVLVDATLGINQNPGDVNRAVETMLKNGAEQATAEDFPDAVDGLSLEMENPDALEKKPTQRAEVKKKARMRPKGSAKRLKTER
jgi:nicotinamidase/pyrazinamidase